MKITITRAFERTRQIADFVPVKAYCEASAEAEWDSENPELRPEKLSQHLQNLCESEVEKTLINYRPVCIACGAKGATVILNKEGICGNCVKKMMFEAKEFAAGNAKNKKP
jgi:hypothetical protein